MKYKLTVVTTTYNQEKYIEKCIKGIVCQKTNFDFQFLISDDNSTDNTRKIIEKYKTLYPNMIRVIYRDKNLGPMENFIQTLNEVHTEYVALCDGDDYWTDKNKLQRQVDFLDNNKDFTICFHRTKIFFDDNSREPVFHPIGIKKDLDLIDLCMNNTIPANTVVYRWIYRKKDSFINDFPKGIVPGDYYVHLMHAAKGRIHYIPKQMSCYRRNSQGMWWEMTQPELRSKFYYNNGLKMLKFYDEIENKLSLDKEIFLPVKRWLINQMLESYFEFRKYRKIRFLYKKYYPYDYEVFANFYKKLGRKRKIIYILSTDIFYKFK